MKRRRTAFSLVELVVVIMILGILAAVAAPKLLQTSGTATDNGLKQTLGVVRDAIELYAAQNAGALPGSSDDDEATFKSDIAPYLRGPFPSCPIGPAKNADVKITSADGDIAGEAEPTKGWHYSTATGEFIVNFTGTSNDSATAYDDF